MYLGVHDITAKSEFQAMGAEEWGGWFAQFLDHHREYIQSTSTGSEEEGRTSSKRLLDLKYAIKLHAMAVWILNPSLEKQKIEEEVEGMLAILMS
jgi:hypothetical protein